MEHGSSSFHHDHPGQMLKRWRKARGVSQMNAALAANVSARHLSYVETGRARPSRALLVRLADILDVPPRDRPILLEAAGFAGSHGDIGLNEGERAEIDRVVDHLLRSYEPFLAAAIDRNWNIVRLNAGGRRLFAALGFHDGASERLGHNLARIVLHPGGVRNGIDNWDNLGRITVGRLRQAAMRDRSNAQIAALLAEVSQYPGILPTWMNDSRPTSLVVPLTFACGDFRARVLSVFASLGPLPGTSFDELRIEFIVPADSESEVRLRSL